MKKMFLWGGYLMLVALVVVACNRSSSVGEVHQYTNALVNESSPYLLQHAHNPVNWYPWGEDALEKAKSEDKLIVISVGYAACHWCHVMEHESFEDTTVARIMNEHYVAIKVDREERPDVDDVYMTACQLASNKGCGWPLNAIALPDGRPIWVGTYFPKKNWLEVLEYFIGEKEKNGAGMEEYAANLTKAINDVGTLTKREGALEIPADFAADFNQVLLEGMDAQRGGRAGAPKFPMPDIHQYLLQYGVLNGNPKALEMATLTLDQMAAGGIYDQLGGGFARYSVDDRWLVPHFEKMLYDNAQLVSLYAAAYAQTGKERYREVVEQTLAFIQRELKEETGGFYSSLDADSEGEEGKFYVWDTKTLDSLLTSEEAKAIEAFYQIRKSGNWEHGKNILHRNLASADVVDAAVLASAEKKLLAARDQRVRPGLDDKILTAWNGLMIKGYVDAAAYLSEPTYLEEAIRQTEFLLRVARRDDGGLWRSHKDGKSSINGFLDDYAITAQALIRLYEMTFDERWLREAAKLVDYTMTHFTNTESDLFFYTSDLDPALITRRTEFQDNVIASANSAMAEALWQLGLLLDNPAYTERSQKMLASVIAGDDMLASPTAYCNWGQLLLRYQFPPYEVAIVGKDWAKLSHEVQQRFTPNAVYLGGVTEGDLALLQNKSVEGETFIYVCQNKICKLPVQTVDEALPLME